MWIILFPVATVLQTMCYYPSLRMLHHMGVTAATTAKQQLYRVNDVNSWHKQMSKLGFSRKSISVHSDQQNNGSGSEGEVLMSYWECAGKRGSPACLLIMCQDTIWQFTVYTPSEEVNRGTIILSATITSAATPSYSSNTQCHWNYWVFATV